jgi:hypothetical protein
MAIRAPFFLTVEVVVGVSTDSMTDEQKETLEERLQDGVDEWLTGTGLRDRPTRMLCRSSIDKNPNFTGGERKN